MASRQSLGDIIKEYQKAEGEEYVHSVENSIVCFTQIEARVLAEKNRGYSTFLTHTLVHNNKWRIVIIIVLLSFGFVLEYGAEF